MFKPGVTVVLGDFTAVDIGGPLLKGAATLSEDGFDISAAGSDIWGREDQFHFVYVPWEGDFDFRMRIEKLTCADPYTKAGVMARESLSDTSKHAYFQVFPDNRERNNNTGGFEFQYRSENGGEMSAIYPPDMPDGPLFPVEFPETWIRLTRVGNCFTGYASMDGIEWLCYSAYDLDLSGTAYIGIAVTSHNANVSTEASIRDIAVFRH